MCLSLSCAQRCVGCSGLQGEPAGCLWAPHDLAAPRARCLCLAARGSGESVGAEMQKRKSNRKQKWCGQLVGGRRLSSCPFPPSSAQRCVYAKAGGFFFLLPTIALSEKILIKYSLGLIGMFLKNAVACRITGKFTGNY